MNERDDDLRIAPSKNARSSPRLYSLPLPRISDAPIPPPGGGDERFSSGPHAPNRNDVYDGVCFSRLGILSLFWTP
jgi:hypothetical protein